MKVVIKPLESTVFKDLEAGDVFVVPSSSSKDSFFMKTTSILSSIAGTVNAINLCNGRHVFLDDDAAIICVDAELTINNKL